MSGLADYGVFLPIMLRCALFVGFVVLGVLFYRRSTVRPPSVLRRQPAVLDFVSETTLSADLKSAVFEFFALSFTVEVLEVCAK